MLTNNQKLNKCYLCGGVEHIYRPGSVRDKQDIKILECTSCGLVFLSSFDHVESFLYEDSAMHGKEVPDVKIWLKEADVDDTRRFQYLKPLLPNRSVLDFGCGAGGFLLKARNLATKVHGVEVESRLKNHFQSNGLTVFNHLSEISDDIRIKGYDIITLFHVLEHFPDPKGVLIELNKVISEDGQIIIEVPNANDSLLTLYNCEAFSNFTYWSCHLYLFTTKTLEMLVSQIGLKIHYIKQIQRYPLSNHLYWLSNGKPGGHQRWHFLDTPELHKNYEKQLASIGKCDTLIASISKI